MGEIKFPHEAARRTFNVPSPAEIPEREHAHRGTVPIIDFALLALAVISVALLIWMTWGKVSPATLNTLLYIDLAICGVFAVDFLRRWHLAKWSWKFPLINFLDIIGMIPAIALTGPLQPFRSLRIVVVIARLARAINRVFGAQFVETLVTRGTVLVVDAIKRPITVAVLDEVGDVLKEGHYTTNIVAALQENRDEIDKMIIEIVKKDSLTSRFRYVPFHDDIIRLVADTVYRMIVGVLDDPRTDELISDLVRENIDQIKAAVRGQVALEEYRERQSAGLTADGPAAVVPGAVVPAKAP
ncbi:MAG: ion transporter [Nocardiaceae bacterium]|nr:ion transporter [Nocardiaceae bacterium]